MLRGAAGRRRPARRSGPARSGTQRTWRMPSATVPVWTVARSPSSRSVDDRRLAAREHLLRDLPADRAAVRATASHVRPHEPSASRAARRLRQHDEAAFRTGRLDGRIQHQRQHLVERPARRPSRETTRAASRSAAGRTACSTHAGPVSGGASGTSAPRRRGRISISSPWRRRRSADALAVDEGAGARAIAQQIAVGIADDDGVFAGDVGAAQSAGRRRPPARS